MASFNQVTIAGNLTRDVELKYTNGGKPVATIGLAINERYKDAGGNWQDKTCFVDVTCFGRTAEVAGEYLSKGSPVLIGGKLDFQQWEKDGQKRSKLAVICNTLQMLGGKRGDETSQVPADDNGSQVPAGKSEQYGEDAPF